MPGPFPKFPEQRRNRTKPTRGEWINLPPLKEPVLPPARRQWSANGRRAWAAWRKDRVCALWGPSDVHFAMETARQYDSLPPNELRLRQESLGLTPRGRQNLRWRVPADATADGEQPVPVRRLRLTEKAPEPPADQGSPSARVRPGTPDTGSRRAHLLDKSSGEPRHSDPPTG